MRSIAIAIAIARRVLLSVGFEASRLFGAAFAPWPLGGHPSSAWVCPWLRATARIAMLTVEGSGRTWKTAPRSVIA